MCIHLNGAHRGKFEHIVTQTDRIITFQIELTNVSIVLMRKYVWIIINSSSINVSFEVLYFWFGCVFCFRCISDNLLQWHCQWLFYKWMTAFSISIFAAKPDYAPTHPPIHSFIHSYIRFRLFVYLFLFFFFVSVSFFTSFHTFSRTIPLFTIIWLCQIMHSLFASAHSNSINNLQMSMWCCTAPHRGSHVQPLCFSSFSLSCLALRSVECS